MKIIENYAQRVAQREVKKAKKLVEMKFMQVRKESERAKKESEQLMKESEQFRKESERARIESEKFKSEVKMKDMLSIMALYERGFPVSEIAEIVGVDVSFVEETLNFDDVLVLT